ncbi:hypothetical protein FEM48_Zijuj05G0173100 [Ziziphus jujuba var. spinosa]|uniref:Uncharacterized protein n=1 Tax=Ziziphus jujuba var. spinosa TaxID=714518 RepID=A0A978VG43_ZIZJJ|nr:hypothetical protein FEM48_Zijuj05G0173100 [Ziziphus jujuba var. spinosa]
MGVLMDMSHKFRIAKNPLKLANIRGRLWSADDVFLVFSESTGTNSIQGITMRMLEQRTLHLNAGSFGKMKRLRRVWSPPISCINNLELSTMRLLTITMSRLDMLPPEIRECHFQHILVFCISFHLE